MPVTMARASVLAGDPLAHAIICGQDGEVGLGTAGTPALPGLDGHDHCPLCQLSGNGVPVAVAAQTVLIIPHPVVRSIEWPDQASAEFTAPRMPQAPPRGPPSLV